MLATSSGVATAIGANTYRMDVRVRITLPGAVVTDVTLSIESLSIDVTQTTDMPDGTRIEAGYPVMGCDMTLSGTFVYAPLNAAFSAAGFFGPYQSKSPLYRQSVLGCAVTVDITVIGGTSTEDDQEWLRKFTGQIQTVTVDPAAGTVALTCVDLRNMLRSLPDLPPVITAPPYNAGLTSEFAIDYLLRQATSGAVSSWPAQRPNCIFAAGFHASLWPEVGTLDSTSSQLAPTFGTGPWGTGLVSIDGSTSAISAATPYVMAHPAGTDVFFEMLIGDGAASMMPRAAVRTADFNDQITVLVTGGVVTARATAAGGTVGSVNLGSLAAGAHKVNVLVHWPVGSTSFTGTAWVDGVQVGTASTTTATARRAVTMQGLDVWTAFTGGTACTPTSGVQVSNESAPTVSAFTPQAVLDPSLNTLQVIPALSGDPWQIIQQIADAEQGVAGFDESGIFRFTNRNTLKSSTSVRTVTSATSLKALQFTQSQGSTYGSVTVPYDGWTFGKAGLLYAITGVHSIPAHTTRTWTVTLPDGVLAASVDNNASVLPSGHTTTDGNSWFRCSSDSGGLNEYLNVVVTLAITTPSRVTITVQNKGASRAWMISPAAKAGGGTYTDIAAGTPALWIGGQPVTAADEATTTFTVDPTLPALSLDSNPWIQDDDTAAQLAFDLADDLSIPKPDLTNIEIVPDPRLQLEDRVEIVDPDASGIDEYAILWGWSLSLSDSDWSMSINARAVAAPGQWILGIAGRTELGSTTFI